MATQVIVIGENAKEKALKPIRCRYYLPAFREATHTEAEPKEYKFVELISRGYATGKVSRYDLMFAYNRDRNCGTLYLGEFNDGVVE